ncbi:hypothetical protein, partial [Burkholderia thailandensis]|uniref:hypothetical protein n=1 Tax=Burkholderia thailandensis TaxID=57975 RepID=UPI0021C573B1
GRIPDLDVAFARERQGSESQQQQPASNSFHSVISVARRAAPIDPSRVADAVAARRPVRRHAILAWIADSASCTNIQPFPVMSTASAIFGAGCRFFAASPDRLARVA